MEAGHKRAREETPQQAGRGRRQKKSRAAPKGTDTFSDPLHQPSARQGWKAERTNEAFQNFYRSMNFFSTEEEFESFLASLRTDLPSTFRITSTSPFAKVLRDKIVSFQKEISVLEIEEEKIRAEPIPWYPGENAWFFSFSRHALRKAPILKKYHQFIVAHSEAGNLSRQEMVSMIPPFFLKVEQHHRVLDMCAAPGSKSAQMIESLHQVDNKPSLKEPTGVMIANDVDEKRCYMLVHQLKRLGSPTAMMTNYPAQGFPIIKLVKGRDIATLLKPASEQLAELPEAVDDEEDEDEDGYTPIDEVNHQDKYFLFDRILCDVPCSGDGTMRKNYDLWWKWHPKNAILLHPLQLKIATRAARLLKVGGRLVYSTCSFHPVEDEAVVAELLRRGQGALELVDVSQELPELKRAPGITKWQVLDSQAPRPSSDMPVSAYKSYDEVPYHRKKLIGQSCFPPENVESLHLDRCVRIFPHLQDSGGFFIAVIQKVGAMPKPPMRESVAARREAMKNAQATAEGEKEKEAETQTAEKEAPEVELAEMDLTQDTPQPVNKKKSRRLPEKDIKKKEEPFLPLSDQLTEIWTAMKRYYGIKDDFPVQQLMARGLTSPKLYFIGAGVGEILWGDRKGLAQLVNTGVRIFTKHAPHGTECDYRLCNDGLGAILPYVTQRIVKCPLADFRILLAAKEPPFTNSFSPSFKASLDVLNIGAVVLIIDELPHDEGTPPVAVVAWRAKTSAHLLVNKLAVKALKLVLLDEETKS